MLRSGMLVERLRLNYDDAFEFTLGCELSLERIRLLDRIQMQLAQAIGEPSLASDYSAWSVQLRAAFNELQVLIG